MVGGGERLLVAARSYGWWVRGYGLWRESTGGGEKLRVVGERLWVAVRSYGWWVRGYGLW